jgi:predicted phosphodiesterase
MSRFLRLLVIMAAAATPWAAAQVTPMNGGAGILRFAVIGDNGSGESPQYDVARQMLLAHATVPFEFVVMLGDNLYGSQAPRDFSSKFEIPYGPLLRMGIPFYAALGNHDRPDNRHYPPFNMSGQRYYSFVKGPVRFFVFDTNFLDPRQVEWIEGALKASTDEWKIAIFHHPIYSDGDRHGSNVAIRVVLEPLFVRYGVDVVFSGHEHIYERTKPQKGIPYFIVGSSGQLRRGGMTPSALTAAGFDQDQVFLLAAIAGDQLNFQAISRTGRTVDAGVIQRRGEP